METSKHRQDAGEEVANGKLSLDDLTHIENLGKSIGIPEDSDLCQLADWRLWLTKTLPIARGIIKASPRLELRALLVLTGDWLYAREHLPCFEQNLIRIAEDASVHDDHTLHKIGRELLKGIAQISALFQRFRDCPEESRGRPEQLKLVADQLFPESRNSVAALYTCLGKVGLNPAPLQDQEAVLGRLIMLSRLRPLVKKLL